MTCSQLRRHEAAIRRISVAPGLVEVLEPPPRRVFRLGPIDRLECRCRAPPKLIRLELAARKMSGSSIIDFEHSMSFGPAAGRRVDSEVFSLWPRQRRASLRRCPCGCRPSRRFRMDVPAGVAHRGRAGRTERLGASTARCLGCVSEWPNRHCQGSCVSVFP
jgi:hypothetical protein